MHVSEIWRYPVKSLRGERLDAADVRPDGIPGDRAVVVRAVDGYVVTARNYPGLLGLQGTLGDDGEPLVDGCAWCDPRSLRAVRRVVWDGVQLERLDSLDRFDVLPITVATDGSVDELGIDRRRLRPNIVVAGVEGLAEREWQGRRIRIGSLVLDAVKLRSRCVMTTFDPDTLEPDPDVLRRIVQQLDGKTALDCAVVEPGPIAPGDPVELL
jgi:uncharacterized protein YcbX